MAEQNEKNDVPEISMANNKKDMLAAYQQAKAGLEQRQKRILDLEKEKEKLRKAASVAAADRAVAEDPARRIHDLKSALGQELTALAGKFEAEAEEYARLKEAVAEKQAELQRIYEVETAVTDLAAVLEAQRSKREEFEVEAEQQRAALSTEIAEGRETWEKEKARHQQAVQEQQEQLQCQRQREQEEYDYTTARKQDQERNTFEDEMAALRKELAQTKETAEREIADKQAELSQREEAVAQREARMDELEAKVNGFSAELETKIAEAVQTATERLKTETASSEALLRKEFEGEKNVLSGKVEALENLVSTQAKQIDALVNQQREAYEKVQDIAIKAVAGARDRVISLPAFGGAKGDHEDS